MQNKSFSEIFFFGLTIVQIELMLNFYVLSKKVKKRMNLTDFFFVILKEDFHNAN